jgi:SAM-dependent methyltransferase
MSENKSADEIKEAVRDHYGKAIKLKVDNACCPPTESTGSSCCAPQPVEFDDKAAERFAKMAGYSNEELADMPTTVTSFGCGNPITFLNVKQGETVLDLGSGSGLDLILAAKKVGESGHAIGLDMTDEMIDVCRKNLEKANITNAEVRKGEMESMPVADNETDWIISNCVINLSPDKEKVFSEAYRVLKEGGQMMISDIVTLDLPDEYRDDIDAWVGCIAGAVEEDEYLQLMKNAGFEDVKIVEKMIYTKEMITGLANENCGCGPEGERSLTEEDVQKYADKVASVRVYAKKS